MKLQGKAERSHLIVWQVLANEDWGLNSDPGFDLPFSLNSAAMQEEFRWTTSLCRHEFDQHFFSSSHLNNKSETSKNCSESYSVVNWTGAVQTDSTACYRFILSCLLLFVLFLYIYFVDLNYNLLLCLFHFNIIWGKAVIGYRTFSLLYLLSRYNEFYSIHFQFPFTYCMPMLN